MRFYDTLQREVLDFKPIEEGHVGMYTCGPTVYRPAHIGNLRTYITADLLRRVLEFEGAEVKQITNITDVGHMTDEVADAGEDRMMLAVEDEGLAPDEIAHKYTEAFLEGLDALNIQRSALYPKATDHIHEMIEVAQKLIERSHAYVAGGNVYYDVDSFPSYGRLSHNTIDSLQSAHRIENDPLKRNSYDFLLWRVAGEGRVMKWQSPWGDGYPGWHIECSAMSIRYLGEQFDIHTGGSDNVFPHHEDEIAQSEGATGHQVVMRWLHGHHLLAEGRRMAKSAQNFYTVTDLIERGFDPLAFRYLVMQTRYRSQMNFTWDAMQSAHRGLENLRKHMTEWVSESMQDGELSAAAMDLDRRFAQSVTDDLDLPAALVVVSEVASADIPTEEKFSLVERWDRVLGLDLARDVVALEELPAAIAEKIAERERARESGDWKTADRLRDELQRDGVELTDTASGPRWSLRR
ncbi:MAG: cysteine--tRNA ligase [Actinobacteria bacterium]|nr:cysteine--tRNA ligase [Actinomycetota bacterium]